LLLSSLREHRIEMNYGFGRSGRRSTRIFYKVEGIPVSKEEAERCVEYFKSIGKDVELSDFQYNLRA
jgi:hypothetical protein